MGDLGLRLFAQVGAESPKGLHQLVAAGLGQHEGFELVIPQREGEPGEEMEMRPHRRADEREQGVNRLAVQRAEINGLLQETQRNQRLVHVQYNGGARVRDRDALADAGGLQRFAHKKHFQQERPVHFFRQPKVLDHAAQG